MSRYDNILETIGRTPAVRIGALRCAAAEARDFVAAAKIPFRSVDLDSVAYQENNRGGQIRAALKERTGWETIPQIFIGGCIDAFDAFREERLQDMLGASGISWDEGFDRDPYSFLPTWLHPR